MGLNSRRQLALWALQFADLGILCGAFLFSDFVRGQGIGWPADFISLRGVAWALIALYTWFVCQNIAGLYRSHRLDKKNFHSEILFGVSLGTVVLAVLASLAGLDQVDGRFLAVVAGLTYFGGVGMRIALMTFLIWMRSKGLNLRMVVVAGSGPRAMRIVEMLKNPVLGYRLIGFVDDEKSSSLAGLPRLGTLDQLPHVLAQHVVDEVFVGLPLRSCYDGFAVAVAHCAEQGIPIRMPLDLIKVDHSRQFLDIVNGVSVASFVMSPVSLWYQCSKRVIDIVLGGILLILLAPFFVAVMILIKLDTPGPAFFIQERAGLNKRPFRLFKFRTMRVNAEAELAKLESLNEADGAVFKIRGDPRITKLGRFLRQSSIDELPQLINVLTGHLSLVGPRPLTFRDVKNFSLNWQRRRFSVKPGLTCLWQVSGRNAISFHRWMELDMEYISRRSLLFDLAILIRTIPAVLWHKGAY